MSESQGSNGGTTERRNYIRYKVANISSLKVKVVNTKTVLQLVTMGAGGCGLLGPEPIGTKTLPTRFFLTFEWESDQTQSVEIQGNVVYSNAVMIRDQPMIYYGVEFIPVHLTKITPMIKKLEALAEKGELQTA